VDLRGGWAGAASRYREALTSAGYLGLLAVGVESAQPAGWTASLGLVFALGFIAWAATYRRARAIAEIATSKIGSAAQGYVELVGRASGAPDELIASPFSGLPCIWYRYRVYEKTGGKNQWREVDSGVSHTTFELSDASGVCRVDPDDAEVLPAETRVSYQADGKQVEELLFAGRPVYVLGEFSTTGGAVAALSLGEDVGFLLAEWKRDPVALRRRFDLDRNGEIDLKEWELARRLATRTVEKQHRELRQAGEDHTLRAPADGRLYLISALLPDKLRLRYLRWSAFHLAVAISALVALVGLQR
jgi:hypothetical protein